MGNKNIGYEQKWKSLKEFLVRAKKINNEKVSNIEDKYVKPHKIINVVLNMLTEKMNEMEEE